MDELPSGRYRARYYGPDGRRYQAPTLFTAKVDARAWLSLRQSEIIRHAWVPPGTEKPKVARLTLADYAKTWMAQRDLKDRTREHYQKLLDQHIVPGLGALPLASITADDVRRWYAHRHCGRTATVCCARSWRLLGGLRRNPGEPLRDPRRGQRQARSRKSGPPASRSWRSSPPPCPSSTGPVLSRRGVPCGSVS